MSRSLAGAGAGSRPSDFPQSVSADQQRIGAGLKPNILSTLPRQVFASGMEILNEEEYFT